MQTYALVTLGLILLGFSFEVSSSSSLYSVADVICLAGRLEGIHRIPVRQYSILLSDLVIHLG